MQRTHFVLVIALLLALPVALVQAKGPPNKITITGPGMHNVEITDPARLADFDLVALLDWERPAPALSTELTNGYQLLFWYRDGNGTFWPAFSVYYFPGATHELGTIFNSSAANGPWYHSTPQGDTAMKQLLAQHGAAVLSTTGNGKTNRHWLVMIGGALLLAGSAARQAQKRAADRR